MKKLNRRLHMLYPVLFDFTAQKCLQIFCILIELYAKWAVIKLLVFDHY